MANEKAVSHKDCLDIGSVFQTLRDFGASDAWSAAQIGGWSDENRERVAELLFSKTKGIGLSSWRFNIGAGHCSDINHPWRSADTFETAPGEYDWTRQANERWFLRAAKRYGVETFIAFANSAPMRMTESGLTHCKDDLKTTNLKRDCEKAFATYLADILEHFESNPDEGERIHFDYLSPLNEAAHEWNHSGQEGCRASNEDMKRVYKAVYKTLKERGIPTQIMGVEAVSPQIMLRPDAKMTEKYGALYGSYIDEFCSDPEMAKIFDHQLCYHSYWSDRIDGPLIDNREQISEKMKKYPEWELLQTEYCPMAGPYSDVEKGGFGRDLGMEAALWVARVIHYDLTLVQATAWQWWTAISPENYKDGLVYTDYKKKGDTETVIESKLMWSVGQFSRFLRPGSKRIQLKGDRHALDGLLGSAYLDATEKNLIVVYVNLGDSPASVQLAGCDGVVQEWIPYVTSPKEEDNLQPYPAVSATGQILIPSQSVVTLVGKRIDI